jgi:hypothetical protein
MSDPRTILLPRPTERREMSSKFKAGDRVRVTTKRQIHGYQHGSRGVVQSGPHNDRGGKPYYLVAMDKDGSGEPTGFLTDELEPDV